MTGSLTTSGLRWNLQKPWKLSTCTEGRTCIKPRSRSSSPGCLECNFEILFLFKISEASKYAGSHTRACFFSPPYLCCLLVLLQNAEAISI